MKQFLAIATFSFALCAAGCGDRGGTGDIVVFDAAAAIDNPRTFDLGEISGDIEFTPLDDSSREALIGNMAELVESRNFWYEREYGSPVKVFDKTGKFVSTRGVIGRGPDELTGISSVAVDWNSDNVYLTGGPYNAKSIFAYNATGNIFARAVDSIRSMDKMTYSDGRMILFRGRFGMDPDPEPGAKRIILEVYSPDLSQKSSVEASDRGGARSPLPGRGVVFPSPGFMSDNGESVIMKEMVCDTVFRYGNGALVPVYVLDFGRYAPPAEALGERATVTWSDSFHYADNMLEGDRYCVVRARNASTDAGGDTIHHLIIDRRNPASGFSALGPEGESGLFLGGVAFTPMSVRDNRLVGYMQALDIVDNAASITNPALATLAATLKEDSNPVIVVATLKR
jgi:hypothetical protein